LEFPQGRTDELNTVRSGSVARSVRSAGLEDAHWLCPIEDRRRLYPQREGMVDGFSLGNHLLLVDFMARQYRERKRALSPEIAGILDRLSSTVDHWQARLETLRPGHFPRAVLRDHTPPSPRGGGTPEPEARAEAGRIPGILRRRRGLARVISQGERGATLRLRGVMHGRACPQPAGDTRILTTPPVPRSLFQNETPGRATASQWTDPYGSVTLTLTDWRSSGYLT
jgi:hypothetical protein